MKGQISSSLKTLRNLWLILIVGIVGVSVLVLILLARELIKLVLNDPPRAVGISAIEREYSFDADTVLRSIANGQQDVFRLIGKRDLYQLGSVRVTPENFSQATPIQHRQFLAWHQTEFETVVEALTNSPIKKPSNEFRLSDIVFRVPCQLAGSGLQWMSFGFFKVMQIEGQSHYFWQHVIINIETERVIWSEAERIEVHGAEQALDFDALNISADAALRVAETMGGAQFRAKYDNRCSVRGRIVGAENSQVWQVDYYTEGIHPISELRLQVDKRTGEGKVVN